MNKKVILKTKVSGIPTKENFEILFEPLSVTLEQGEILLKVEWVSLDPSHIIWLSGVKSYMEPVKIGETVRSLGVGIIVHSNSPGYKTGTYVSGFLGLQQYCKTKVSNVRRIPTNANPCLYLGVLGMTGFTAFIAIKELGKAQKKQVVVISTAAGAVGSVALQVAKNIGCKVVGITGSEEKVKWLKELGADGVINYKTENVANTLKKICPEGIDLYLDNVGGEILDAVLINANKGSRIILCGAINAYSQKKANPVYMYPLIIAMSIKVKGFIVTDYYKKYKEGHDYLYNMYKQGKLKYKEDIIQGLDNVHLGLQKLLSGENIGKMLIRVDHDSPKI
jgi:NADPH-dependent curcumin reductase CurA